MALFIVPTPIGNLGDITQRAVDVLRKADFIIAEDSRYSRKLLNHLGIQKRIISHFKPQEYLQADRIIPLLKHQDAALITDSGTPALSDPGHILINRAIAEGIQVISLPGPSALLTALVGSGLSSDRFLFMGFPPRRPGPLREWLAGLAAVPWTMVFYESPRRLKDFLHQCRSVFGTRPFAIAKELTKKNEKIIRGQLADLDSILDGEILLGEMTVVVAGLPAVPAGDKEKESAPTLNSLDDLYAFMRDRHRISKNQLKRILQKKGPKRG